MHRETEKQSKRNFRKLWWLYFQNAKLGDMVRKNNPPLKKGNLLIKKISKTPSPSPFLPKTTCLCQGQPGKTQWATVGCLRTAGWGRLQCMTCHSQEEWGEHPAGKRRVSGWGTRVQAGLRGVSHREGGAALYRVSEPMWSKEAPMLVDGLVQSVGAQEGWGERIAQQRELKYVWGEKNVQKGTGNRVAWLHTRDWSNILRKMGVRILTVKERSYKYGKEES